MVQGVVGLRQGVSFFNQRSMERVTIEGNSPVDERKIASVVS